MRHKPSKLRPVAIVAALVVLVGGVGVFLVLLGGTINGSGRGVTPTWIAGALVLGTGWFLVEIAGFAVAEAAVLPFRWLFRRVVPESVQTGLATRVGGPVLLLGLLMLVVCLVIVLAYS